MSVYSEILQVEYHDFVTVYKDLTLEYRDHPHDLDSNVHLQVHHYHIHHAPSVYHKYDGIRPPDLTKLIPMATLLGLYLITPTFIHIRRKRDSVRRSQETFKLPVLFTRIIFIIRTSSSSTGHHTSQSYHSIQTKDEVEF